jgi:GTP-binding protein
MRSSTSEIVERLEPPIRLSLEESLEFIAEDEIAEITPSIVRMRKRVLDINDRHKLLRPSSSKK